MDTKELPLVKAPAKKRAAPRAAQPRKWRNRRPVRERIDLAESEAEARENKRVAEQRVRAIHVQLTDAERRTIESRATADHRRLSDYVRRVLLSTDAEAMAPRMDPALIRALTFQLSKIGTNLNQLAKVANETRSLQAEAHWRAVSDRVVLALDKVIRL